MGVRFLTGRERNDKYEARGNGMDSRSRIMVRDAAMNSWLF